MLNKILELLHINSPTPVAVLEPEKPYERPKGTFHLWDKDFNLLHTWTEGERLYVTLDHDGGRWSGEVEFGRESLYRASRDSLGYL